MEIVGIVFIIVLAVAFAGLVLSIPLMIWALEKEERAQSEQINRMCDESIANLGDSIAALRHVTTREIRDDKPTIH